MPSPTPWDVIIVGAGPAGLSAALILGRCRRRVLLLDTDRPRNDVSPALHGFLTRDGIHPRELRRLGRQQLAPYKTVRFQRAAAKRARKLKSLFQVTLEDGRRETCRKLLLASGVSDDVPEVEGLRELYGHSVFHCPYCDGWECRDAPIAIYARSRNGVGLAIEMRLWSKDLLLCTDGFRLSAKDRERLARYRIPAREDRIARLAGRRGELQSIVFAAGDSVARRYLFFSSGQQQGCDLPEQLGCSFTNKGAVRTGKYEATDIPGVYVAGDASRLVQLAIVAAAEGAQAAFAINTDLIKEDL